MHSIVTAKRIALLYVLLCVSLIVKAYADCIDARELGVYFCSETEYRILTILLFPTSAVGHLLPLDWLTKLTEHADEVLLLSMTAINAFILWKVYRYQKWLFK